MTRITVFIALYFLSVTLYLFADDSRFWDLYFNVCTLSVSIFLGIEVLRRKRLQAHEFSAITFLICYKILTLLYLLIGSIFNSIFHIEKHIAFIATIGITAFMAWLYVTFYKKGKE